MASDDPRQLYQKELERLSAAEESGTVDRDEADAVRGFLKAKDPGDLTVNDPDGETLAPSSLAAYAQALRLLSKRHDDPLTDTTADAVNELMQSIVDGTHPDVKDDGLSKNTVAQHQSAARKFYQYHPDVDIDANRIVIFRPERTPVDDRDMFDPEEVEAMRDGIDNPRDKCLFELLIFTGQRIRVVQTLRVKDVDTDHGVFWINEDADGTKGAERNGKKRPLLGAKRAVYDWLQYHPTGDPDDYLITIRPSANRGTPGGKVHQSTINRVLKGAAEDAGVADRKNVHAHLFRHYFVTVAKRDYGLDNDTIKHLVGQQPDSKIMETTYSHLSDDDYIQKAGEAFGTREPEDEGSLTPTICPTCSEQLAANAKACPACGNVFAPDAKQVKEQIDDDLWESKGEASEQMEAAIDQLKQVLKENPALYEDLTESANTP
jgi:integrase